MLPCLLILIAAIVARTESSNCDSFDPFHPCSCRTFKDKTGEEFAIVSCQGLHSEDALQSVVAATRHLPMFELELIDCALRYLPHDAFVDTSFQVISIQNSSIAALSDSDIAFEGLETQLHLIEIINCTYTSNWDWRQLRNLRHLMEIHVSDSELIDITEGISMIQHLDVEAFVFPRNKIHSLGEQAFAPFLYLERLTLDNNYITNLKRSMLPNPAQKLKIFGLSYNQLTDLPDDMFQNMPALKSLYLTGNPLVTIDEVVFRPIWRTLHLFLFYSTRLSCDCRIQWLTKEDNSAKFIHAECQRPTTLRGRFLEKIQSHELWC